MSSTATDLPSGCEISRIFENPRSKILWKFGHIFTERETYGDDDIAKAFITEVCGTCVATQGEGPNPGVQGIAKVRMQYVCLWTHDSNLHGWIHNGLAAAVEKLSGIPPDNRIRP